MKKIITTILMISSFQALAYREWSDLTPISIYTTQNLGNMITRTIKIRTKTMVNVCAGFMEGFKFRAKVVHCTDQNLELKMEYKSRNDCQAGMVKSHTFKIKLPKGCEFSSDPYYGQLTINQKTYKNH